MLGRKDLTPKMKSSNIILLLLVFLLTVAILFGAALFSFHLPIRSTKLDEPPGSVLEVLSLPRVGMRNLKFISSALNNRSRTISNPYDVNRYSPVFFSLNNNGNLTSRVKFSVNKKDWTSLKTITEQALESIDKPGDEERAFQLWQYLKENAQHDLPPYTDFQADILNSPVVMLNVFGYGACGNFASSLALLANQAGFEARAVYLKDHAVTEIFYGNSWHMFDANLGILIRNPEGSIASIADIYKNPSLIDQINNFEEKYPGSKQVFQNAFSEGRPQFIRNIAEIKKALPVNTPENIEYVLNPGDEIRLYYAWRGKYIWSDFDYRKLSKSGGPENFTNGLLISDASRVLNGKINGKISFYLPYPLLDAVITADEKCRNVVGIVFSLDGEQWIDISSRCRNGIVKLSDLFPNGPNSRSINSYSLKFSKKTDRVRVYTQFQIAPKSIPYLVEGINKMEFKGVNTDSVRVDFAYLSSK